MRYGLGILGLIIGMMSSSVLAQPPAQRDTLPLFKSANVRVKAALKTCYACHGPGGVSRIPSRPNLAGQKAEYVLRQILAFKRAATENAQAAETDVNATGTMPQMAERMRTDPTMEHLASALDAALVPQVAVALSQLACRADDAPQKTPTPPAISRQCSACHGDNGIGIRPEIPNLAGQKRTYLRRQLLLIREAAWGAHLRAGESWRRHPIMERQTARLKIEDVDTLAQYYADLDCRGGQK